jgi:p-cumate 2,3-dioxygenase alpha subunit
MVFCQRSGDSCRIPGVWLERIPLMAWSENYRSRFLDVDLDKGRFRVSRTAFSDPAVFQEAKEKILYRSWLYLGHESEFPNRNDFLVRQVLDAEILVTRDSQLRVNAFYNTCGHRGALLCRERAGNKALLTCPYHAWTYRTDGSLLTRGKVGGYCKEMDDDRAYDLKPVPQLAQRGGFYFVNFSADTPTLDEHLGKAGEWIDTLLEHSAEGLEVISGLQEYQIRANYKLMCENSMDGYHLVPTHGSYLDYQRHMLKGMEVPSLGGHVIALGNGHSGLQSNLAVGRPIAQWMPSWGEPARTLIEQKKEELVGRLGQERGEFIANTNRIFCLFPLTLILDSQSIQVRTMVPIAHDRMISRIWLFGAVNEDPEIRRVRLEGALSFLGPGGFATPDDVEMLEISQRGYAIGGVEWNDISKGFHAGEDTADGELDQHIDNEIQMRTYWVEYDRIMNDGPSHDAQNVRVTEAAL